MGKSDSDKSKKASNSGDILIVVGDDGKAYRLVADDWKRDDRVITNPQALGVINQLANYGVLLADMPDDIGLSDGLECKLVNLKALDKSGS